ncbi:TIGR04255 family protein [Gimibacter soli]|uniref:TIGR04255 family protein n=1 Tax=Gimibacter soli TaxID=3024400 RepID=A0AAF0BLP4_9PROT|nr:TIGR04255 family protein [Gimibacter soli]WCL54407.1 TIGR04255 family protein [Gimibacter soli]
MQTSRPDHLPDYTHPPLDEVVVGLQFTACPTYTSLGLHTLHDLFSEEFPSFQEQFPMDATFETFGGSRPPGVQFRLSPPPLRPRSWFIAADESHLLQFQNDRLLLNWRRRDGNRYPRFEGMAENFSTYFERLKAWYKAFHNFVPEVTQAEISYFNIIPVSSYSEIEDWFRFSSLKDGDIENVSSSFVEILKHSDGRPCGRLFGELISGLKNDGSSFALRLNFTVRGAPDGTDLVSAIKFLEMGRDKIVTTFDKVTTEQAHKAWGKVQ